MLKGILLTAAAAVALAAAGSAVARSEATPTLNATVGPGFTISLTQGGKKVTRLKAGTYRIVVSDRSSAHNFVLERERGGAFERTLTSVGFTGTKTVTVRLGNGSWKYYCEPHESVMHGAFTVGAGAATAADDHGSDG